MALNAISFLVTAFCLISFHLYYLSFTVLCCYPIPFLVNSLICALLQCCVLHPPIFLQPPALLPPVAFISYMCSTALLLHPFLVNSFVPVVLPCHVLFPIFSQHSSMLPPVSVNIVLLSNPFLVNSFVPYFHTVSYFLFSFYRLLPYFHLHLQ